MKKGALIIVSVLLIVAAVWAIKIRGNDTAGSDSASKQASSQAKGFNKGLFSLTDPTSIWVIVDKHRPLQPKNYAPTDLVTPDIPLRLSGNQDEMKLRKVAAEALKKMSDAAARDGLKLMVSSGYRSYNYQVNLYNYYVQKQGKVTADTQSARPGFSEHQTGLAVDLEPTSRACEVETCFADTPEGKWLAANAHTYGFVLRYQKNKQAITGYIDEPWHFRYVGTDLTTELQKRGNPTLEEFFGLDAAPDYL